MSLESSQPKNFEEVTDALYEIMGYPEWKNFQVLIDRISEGSVAGGADTLSDQVESFRMMLEWATYELHEYMMEALHDASA